MTKKDQHFPLWVGDYQQILFPEILDDNGDPYVGLETGTLEWKMYETPDYENPVISKSSANGEITVPDVGKVLVVVLGENTENLSHGNYYHTLTFTKDTHRKTVATGMIILYTLGSEYLR
jgi:hypothetical protein